MELFFKLCGSVSVGIIIGFLLGGIKAKVHKNSYSEKQIEYSRKCIRNMAGVLKYVTIVVLLVGLIWCIYFLILGIVRPQQADYANNMAELIVAVLTIISIIFAFVEFLRMTDDTKLL